MKLNAEIMGHVTFGVMLVVTAFVMWTHARFTEKPSQKPAVHDATSTDHPNDETDDGNPVLDSCEEPKTRPYVLICVLWGGGS